MRELLNSLFTSLRAKFTGLWSKLRLLGSAAFWKNTVFNGLRDFFAKIFNVRPRHKGDYYTTRRWLISRRLVAAVVICLGILSLVVLWLTLPSLTFGSGAEDQLRTYRYNSLGLKFHEGNIRILAKDGHVAYVGAVSKGEARGMGTLYDQNGNVIYEGQFDGSMYNGNGTLHYSDGTKRYEGGFLNNLYSGTGTQYRPSGVEEYHGEFSQGLRNGKGTLYNSGGNAVFTGNFVGGNLLFSELVGKTTTELATMYTGDLVVYSAGDDFCVAMNEVNAVYAVNSGADTLESEWKVNSVYVLGSQFPTADGNLTTLDELNAHFGGLQYSGSTYLTLPEAVAANLLAAQPQNLGKVDMVTTASFENALTVERYDRNMEVYLYSFTHSGMVYNFYCQSATSGFLMYSIEMA